MAPVTLERDGRRQDVNAEQLTTENLRRMFQVNPLEVWLRDIQDDTAFFPEPDGTFDLGNAISTSIYIVEGPLQTPLSTLRSSRFQGSSVYISSASTNLPPPPPSFRSVTATRRPSFKSDQSQDDERTF